VKGNHDLLSWHFRNLLDYFIIGANLLTAVDHFTLGDGHGELTIDNFFSVNFKEV
jgi:hypothetical protein